MARLIVHREPRGLDEGLPSAAVAGSMGVHTVVLLLLFWGGTRLALPAPAQVYQVDLVAAPTPAPVRTVPVRERPRPTPSQPRARPVETKPKPEEPVDRAEESTEPTVVEQPAAAPDETREGADDLPVRLEGAPFPYPEYLANIIVQIKRHWRPPVGARQLRAELAFTLLRDGSVADVAWVRRSGNPAFDLEARGAIEAAGRRGVFGALPAAYPSDQLRVSFFLDPTRY